MKKSFSITSFSFCVIIIGLLTTMTMTSCLEDTCDETQRFLEYTTVYVQPEEFRIPIVTESTQEMEETGKFYFYNNNILINEKNKGIHVIDNSNPESPQNIAFVEIPGNLDMAIRDNILYADNYVDLLTIDITDINNPRLLCRDEDVFENYGFREELGYFIGYESTGRTIEVDCNSPNFGSEQFQRGNFELFDSNIGAPSGNTTTGGTATDGQAGSQARFSLKNDYLYVINNSELISYNIENPSKPDQTNTTTVSWNIETLFPYEDYLFIGSQNGVFIYDLASPESPEYLSDFQHANACDPVFVKDDIAYVTLRDGTMCQNFINQLDVLDVSNIRNPRLIKSYDMEHPHGLSVRGNNLYLCEGEHGLKVFETDELEKIDDNRIDHVKDIDAFDAISLNADHLLVIGADGLYQYDTSDPSKLKEMSFLSVAK